MNSEAIDRTEAALQLARNSDVLIENFRPGVMERLKLDYATLNAIKPVSQPTAFAFAAYAHHAAPDAAPRGSSWPVSRQPPVSAPRPASISPPYPSEINPTSTRG